MDERLAESLADGIEDIRKRLLRRCEPGIDADEAARLMEDAFVLTCMVDVPTAELPDYVRALAYGEPDRAMDVVAVALEDLLAEEQVNDLTSPQPASPQPASPQPSPFSGENREGGQESGQGLVVYALGIAVLAVVVMALIGLAQSVVGVFSANPAGMVESIRDIPAPATVDQINETTAVIIGTMAVTKNPVEAAAFEAEIQQKAAHPLEKHGEEAVAVENCIDGGGTLAVWMNPDTQRTVKLCQIPDGKYRGKYGLHIEEANGDWVTSFLKNKYDQLDQVLAYLVRAGYLPF
jgi:putative hemolysin